MKEMLQKLREASVAAILQADDITALENLRVKYLGKKGELRPPSSADGSPVGGGAPGHGSAWQTRCALSSKKRSDQRRETLNARMLEMRPSRPRRSM